jgi:hypothetical protein
MCCCSWELILVYEIEFARWVGMGLGRDFLNVVMQGRMSFAGMV